MMDLNAHTYIKMSLPPRFMAEDKVSICHSCHKFS